jgi:hypothetical protein
MFNKGSQILGSPNDHLMAKILKPNGESHLRLNVAPCSIAEHNNLHLSLGSPSDRAMVHKQEQIAIKYRGRA